MYQSYYGQVQQMSYNQQVIQVNGKNGAKAFQMMPNASVLLLDSTAPLVWLAQTDGAGYKTVTPYKIEKYQPPQPPDINALMERLERMEARLNESNFTETSRKSAETTEQYDSAVVSNQTDDWQQSKPIYATDVTKSTVSEVRRRK